MTNSSIRSCKICNGSFPKITYDPTPGGFRSQKDEQGRWWTGRVCPDCTPKHRKVAYRRTPEEYPEQGCKGCGKTFRPKRKSRTGTCSAKCAMRVSRGNSVSKLNKDVDLLKTTLGQTPQKETP